MLPAVVTTVSGVAIAWATGGLRRYGHRLERLADLAAKMPEDSQAQKSMLAAVDTEAARLLEAPQSVRWALRLLAVVWFLGFLGWQHQRLVSGGLAPAEAGAAVTAAVFTTVLVCAFVHVLEFVVTEVRRQRRERRLAAATVPGDVNRGSAPGPDPGGRVVSLEAGTSGREPRTPAHVPARDRQAG